MINPFKTYVLSVKTRTKNSLYLKFLQNLQEKWEKSIDKILKSYINKKNKHFF